MNLNLLVKLFLILFLFLLSLIGYTQNLKPKDSLSYSLNEVVVAQKNKRLLNETSICRKKYGRAFRSG